MLFFSVGFDLLAAAHHTPPPTLPPIGCHNNVGPPLPRMRAPGVGAPVAVAAAGGGGAAASARE